MDVNLLLTMLAQPDRAGSGRHLQYQYRHALISIPAAFAGDSPDPAGDRRWHAHLPVGAVNWPANWITAADGLPVYSKWRLPARAYIGVMNSLGLDIGITAGEVMAWGVITPNAGPMRGKLAGKYVGASGSIGLGVGVGANVLVGGSNRSISLQPLSVQGTVGINLSLGISGLTLTLVQ
jgi:hypothetical protein